MSASAIEEAYRRYQGDWDAYNQEPVDDCGCAQSERRAFIAGAQFAAERNSKRLTDAELAAEYQFSRLDSRVRMARVENYGGDKVLFDHYERGLDQEATFERFATHPHYDEERA